MQKGRVITICLIVEDETASESIWDAHANNALVAGCQVQAIGNGNIFKDRDRLNDLLGDAVEYLEGHLGDDKAEALLDKIEESDKKALSSL